VLAIAHAWVGMGLGLGSGVGWGVCALSGGVSLLVVPGRSLLAVVNQALTGGAWAASQGHREVAPPLCALV
jgi:hypothetical protein